MGTAFKAIILAFVVVFVLIEQTVDATTVIVWLLVVASNVYRIRFRQSRLLIFAELGTVSAVSFSYPSLLPLLAISAYDIVGLGMYWVAAIIPLAGYLYLDGRDFAFFALLITLSGLSAHFSAYNQLRSEEYLQGYDRERQLRYELEGAKVKLQRSSHELVHVAEIRERNRIAREIHDSAGHSLAGILLRLQAARKVLGANPEAASSMIQECVERLAESLTMLRNTVHNIKPQEKLGLKEIEAIISSFTFCPVEFQSAGDFSNVPPNHLGIMAAAVRELLTNTIKHSGATKVNITLEVAPMYVRLAYADNGQGRVSSKEGLGLSGIRERAYSINGTVSIDGRNGFLAVCVLPLGAMEGGRVLEGARS